MKLEQSRTFVENPASPDQGDTLGSIGPLSGFHERNIEQAARAIKAMAHPLRLKILCALDDREASVQEIVDLVGTSQSNVSQHLAILRDKGILTSRKDANRVFYRIGEPRMRRLMEQMREVFCNP